LQHAAVNPEFANSIFNDFFRPKSLMKWITDMEAVQQRIAATNHTA
jgi:hypothetical protein